MEVWSQQVGQVLHSLGLSQDGRSAEVALREMVDEDLRVFEQAQAGGACEAQVGVVGGRLRSLLGCLQEEAPGLDWRDWAMSHPALLRPLIHYFHAFVPPPIKELTAQLLVVVEAALQGLLLSQRVGLEEEEVGGLTSTQRRQLWSVLLLDLLESGVRVNARVAHQLLAKLLELFDWLQLSVSSSSSLVGPEELDLLTDLLSGLIYYHHQDLGNAVVLECAQRTVFMETLLHRLNAFGFPHHAAPQVTWQINLIMGILEDPVSSGRALYTNDFRVLCDITLRELQSLQLKDSQALDYLGLASSLVATPAWRGYRKADFAALLENLSTAMAATAATEGEEVDVTVAAAQCLAASIRQALLTSP